MLASPLLGNLLGTSEGFSIAEWIEPPCSPEGPVRVAPLHLHVECDEAWVVLEGTLTVLVGDQEETAEAGDAILVPRGTAHTYWNPGPEPCRYLLVMTAATRRLILAIHATDDRSLEGMKALFEAHGAMLLESVPGP